LFRNSLDESNPIKLDKMIENFIDKNLSIFMNN